MTSLDRSTASHFARIALAHVRREYPNKPDHVLTGPGDVRSPRELHPVFYGSFDWHSNVHGYWLLATLLRMFPDLPEAGTIVSLFDEQFAPAKVTGELAYLAGAERGTFERPYGWAWLLMLAAELGRHDTARGRGWATAIAPLGRAFAERFRGFLPRATYPIRVGTHFNTAFALALAHEYAEATKDESLGALLAERARAWYLNDADCQVWEPGGDDFLSSSLIEAECMGRVMPREEWSQWVDRFLPRIAHREPRTLFEPAVVADRSDGKIAHLEGLNLSRAWCWRSLAARWTTPDPRRGIALETAERHLAVSLPHVAGEYAGEHWLATFALLALMANTEAD